MAKSFDVLLGWTAEEIVGLSSTTLIHPEGSDPRDYSLVADARHPRRDRRLAGPLPPSGRHVALGRVAEYQ